MNNYEWIENYKKRIFLIFMSKPRYREYRYSDDAITSLAHNNLSVLITSELPKNRIIAKLDSQGLIRDEAMLVLSPYETDVYEDIEGPVFKFSERKITLYSQFCQLLGAKEVKVDLDEEFLNRIETQHHAKVKHPAAEGRLSYTNEDIDKFKRSVVHSGKYRGVKPDFEEATKLLNAKNLLNDTALRSLAEERRNNNNLLSKTVSFNSSSEIENQFKLLSSLSAKHVKLGISYDYTRVTQSRYEFMINLDVIF